MAAKPKIFRYFAQRRGRAIVLEMALDEVEHATLVGGEVEIVHTYKCTYFGARMQERVAVSGRLLVRSWAGIREKVKGQRSKVKGQRSRSKVKGQRSKVKGQRSKVKGQRSKVKGQRSKVKHVAT